VQISAQSLTRTAIALGLLALAACSSGGGGDETQPESPPIAPPPEQPPPTALFVLGDSLSDVGNAAGAADYLLNVVLDPPTVGLCNPADVLVARLRCDDLYYLQSRVSNGPVAVEHLAAHFKFAVLEPSLHLLPLPRPGGTVYAVASAKARGVGDEDLARQIDWLLLDHTPLPSDALYVVMIGGNDAIDALQADVASLGAAVPPSSAIVTSAVEAIGLHVERLLDFGARRVIVANVPDLALLPAVRAAARASADETGVLARASAISSAFDQELSAKLSAIRARGGRLPPAPVIARFDLRAALSRARLTMAASGANTLDACFDSELYRASAAGQRAFHRDCAPASAGAAPRFTGFAFFDGIHPSGVLHAAIGDALRELL
jgi:phospholipase/lecithinase/hemolysin